MQEKLPKTNQEYRAILKESWGIDIDKDEIVGRYSLSQSGTQGFFNNCTTVDGKLLKYPDNKYQLRILIKGNSLDSLNQGSKYRFRVQFAALDKRLQLNPFLLVTQRDSVTATDSVDRTRNTTVAKSQAEPTTDSNLKSVVTNIYYEKLNQNNPYNVIDLAEAVDALAIDIYSENKRFIYELIQNADDAAVVDQSELRIEITSGYVVLSHNGKPFDERDLRGLCGIGRGTKRDDEAKTGYKGIGFKSVFGQPDGLVYIKTNELLFRFDRSYILKNGWNTKWGNQDRWEKENLSNFKSPWQLIPVLSESTNNDSIDQILNSKNFTVKTAIKIQNENELAEDINALFSDARFLLFLRKINKVTLVHSTQNLCISKRANDKPAILSLYRNELNISSWYLRRRSYDIPSDIKRELQLDVNSPKKLQEMIQSEISFAFKLGNDLKSISLLPSNESCIFTYLPTSVTEFNFPFLVNSNFLVDAGREKIHKDRIWNKWLFKVIGWELIKCCAEFAVSDTFNKDYLKILLPDYLPENDPLKQWFNEGLKIGLNKVDFILNDSNQLAKISEIVVDEVGILTSGIIPNNTIINFINNGSDSANIIEQNFLTPFSESSKLIHFGAKTFSLEDLKVFFQSQLFSSNHQFNQNYNLLKYLKQLDKNDFSGEWNYIVRNTPFIYSDKKNLEKIPLVCFPVTTYVTGFGKENTLIDQELYNSFSQDIDLTEWLKTVGVKEPSEIAYLEKEIIGKIDECVDSQNYLNISEFILRLHLTKKLKEFHYNALREFQLKTNNGWSKAKNIFLPDTYNPTVDFSQSINSLTLVSLDYLGDYNAFEWKSLFVSIGVADDINIIQDYAIKTADKEFSSSYFTEAIAYGKDGHTYPNLVPQNRPAYITYFTFFVKTTNYSYSLIFWERLITKYSISIEADKAIYNSHGPSRKAKVYKLNSAILKSIDFMGWGYFDNNRVCIPSFVLWYIKTQHCIPTNQKECCLAAEVFTNSDKILELGGEHIPVIKVSKTLSKEWTQLLGLKSKLALSDLLKIISSINNEVSEKGYLKRDNEKRLGLVYNEIINSFNELSAQEEKEISEWAKKNRFICNDNLTRRSSEIIWLRIQGFNNQNNEINTLLIPKNVVINENTENLFSLFGIQIVDRCDYEVIEEKEDISLLIKVLSIIPAISLILKSRMKIKDEKGYLDLTFNKVGTVKFCICKEILLVLNYKSTKITGSRVKYYLSDSGFYYTNNWQSPLERFAISQYLVTFLKCKGLEQEIQLFLELSNHQINQYLESIGLDLDIVKSLPIYEEIEEKILALKEYLRINVSSNSFINPSDLKNNLSGEYEVNDEKGPVPDANEAKHEPKGTFFEEVEDFIRTELEDTEWAEYIPELKGILELSLSQPKEKQKLYNLIAKLKLAKATSTLFDKADKDYNQLIDGDEKYYIHSARGSFAYIHPNEILSMRNNGYRMALDFGSQMPIKIYYKAEDILSLNTNHLLAYQFEKTMDDLFMFCEQNKDANKHLLIVDKDVSRVKSNDIFKLLNPEDDYQ